MSRALNFLIAIIFTAYIVRDVNAYNEIIGMLDEAKDLAPEERNALRPLFHDLQSQYDLIVSDAARQTENQATDDMRELYETTNADLQARLKALFSPEIPETIPAFYDVQLPSINEIMGNVSIADMTQTELDEFLDMQSILEESLQEAQRHIDEITRRSMAMAMELTLLKLNKPKILGYIYRALSLVFGVSVRVSRAAYCTYSQIPQLNESLHNLYDGIDCYTYASNLIAEIQRSTVHTVTTIKSNVFDLAAVYKKAAGKHSLLGKLVTVILNMTKIAKDIRETYAVAMQANDRLQNEVPNAVKKSLDCGIDFAGKVPQMLVPVANVTACILFVDNTTQDYDFLKPESERN